jgi:hypothetical protein
MIVNKRDNSHPVVGNLFNFGLSVSDRRIPKSWTWRHWPLRYDVSGELRFGEWCSIPYFF